VLNPFRTEESSEGETERVPLFDTHSDRQAVDSLRIEQVRPKDVAESLEVAEQVRVRTVQAGQTL
jgi:hypothetical protein